jgi:hypothetical protein
MKIPFSTGLLIVIAVAIVSGVAGMVISPEQSVAISTFCTMAVGGLLTYLRTQQNSDTLKEHGEAIKEQGAVTNEVKVGIEEVKRAANGLTAALVKSTAEASHSQGMLDEKASEAAKLQPPDWKRNNPH